MNTKKKIRKLQKKIARKETRHMLEMSDLKIALGSATYRADLVDIRNQLLVSENVRLADEIQGLKELVAKRAESLQGVIVGDETNTDLVDSKTVN